MKLTMFTFAAVFLCLAATAQATGRCHCPHGQKCAYDEKVFCDKPVCKYVPTCVAGDPQKCYYVDVNKCDDVWDKVCEPKQFCDNKPFDVCKNEPKKVCDNKKVCKNVNKCEKKQVKVCSGYDCKLVWKTQCHSVPVCENVASCKTIYVKKCYKDYKKVCYTKQICKNVKKQVCNKQKVKKCDPFPDPVKCGDKYCEKGEKCENKQVCANPICKKKHVPVCKPY